MYRIWALLFQSLTTHLLGLNQASSCLCRKMHSSEQKAYTVWNMATLARKRNHGSRVDFLLAGRPDPALKDHTAAPEEEVIHTATFPSLHSYGGTASRKSF